MMDVFSDQYRVMVVFNGPVDRTHGLYSTWKDNLPAAVAVVDDLQEMGSLRGAVSTVMHKRYASGHVVTLEYSDWCDLRQVRT